MNSFHHIVYWLFPSGAAVAEWVAAIATGVLACFAWIPLSALRKSLGDSAKAQQDKKRADQFERLKWLDSRFNSPAMLKARSALGKWGLDPKREIPIAAFNMPGGNAWTVIYFFAQIAQMQKQNLLDLDDIDVAYGDYIDLLWVLFEQNLTKDFYEQKFEILGSLHRAIDGAPYVREFKPLTSGLSPASAPKARKVFLEREAALYP